MKTEKELWEEMETCVKEIGWYESLYGTDVETHSKYCRAVQRLTSRVIALRVVYGVDIRDKPEHAEMYEMAKRVFNLHGLI